jgi:hypothetical protein
MMLGFWAMSVLKLTCVLLIVDRIPSGTESPTFRGWTSWAVSGMESICGVAIAIFPGMSDNNKKLINPRRMDIKRIFPPQIQVMEDKIKPFFTLMEGLTRFNWLLFRVHN